jgi:tyrosinase
MPTKKEDKAMKAKGSSAVAAASTHPDEMTMEARSMGRSSHETCDLNAVNFAGELKKLSPALRKRLNLPPWLFGLFNQRKDQATLTDTARGRFLCALNVLNQNGVFGQLVDIHGDMSHMMHGNPRFLPWHRIYLLKFEQALQSIHPDVTIPYWDWTQAGEQSFPSWLQGVTPTVVTPTRTIQVTRFPGTPQDLHQIASNTPTVMQATNFVDFWSGLEGIHNSVHVWVGGSMGSIPTAPADPIFWMHHANIDRLWWQWQQSPHGQGKNPNLVGAAAVMDPWAYTEADTRDIATLGYSYV